MLKEEKAFYETMRDVYGIDNSLVRKRIRALIRGVREDCAGIVESCGNDEMFERIADSVRKGNNKPFMELFGPGGE